MKSHTLLRRWYLANNRKYFDNLLPLDTELVIEPLDAEHAKATKLDDGRYKLSLDPGCLYFTKFAKMMFLHEMAHIHHWVQGRHGIQHGQKFQEEMLRLAAAGAFKDIW
jgi:SprT-like family protein